MSRVKRDLEAHEEMAAYIEKLGLEERALVSGKDADDVRSTDDEDAAKRLYARAFTEWAAGRLKGDARDIFDAVTDALES